MKEAMVHTAIKTKKTSDHLIQIDISRIDAFNWYDQLDELVIFSEEQDAKAYAMRQYLSQQPDDVDEDEKGASPKLFRQYSTMPSNDETLKALYGADNVLMQKKLVSIIYALDVPNNVEKIFLASKGGFQVKRELKEKLNLQVASIFDVVFYLTSRYAKEKGQETTRLLINHSQLSPLDAEEQAKATQHLPKYHNCVIS
jgi:hypothetical protein